MFRVFKQSVIGASHVRKGIPCEDYGIKYSDEKYLIFALGDGHGASECFRSSIGSDFVCKEAVTSKGEIRQVAPQQVVPVKTGIKIYPTNDTVIEII